MPTKNEVNFRGPLARIFHLDSDIARRPRPGRPGAGRSIAEHGIGELLARTLAGGTIGAIQRLVAEESAAE